MNAENRKPGIRVARGAMATAGAPIVANVNAVIGTPNTMPASILLLVSIGSSLTMFIVLVKKSLLSTAV